MTGDSDHGDQSNQVPYPYLSKKPTYVAVTLDHRGIHIIFFESVEDFDAGGLESARYVYSLSLHNALDLARALLNTMHVGVEILPYDFEPGAPSPLPASARLINAGSVPQEAPEQEPTPAPAQITRIRGRLAEELRDIFEHAEHGEHTEGQDADSDA